MPTTTIQPIHPWYKSSPLWLIPQDWEVLEFDNVFQSISTKKYQIKNTEILDSWEYKVVDQWNWLIAGFSNEKEKLYKDLPVIVFWDHTTNVKYINFEFVVGADWTKILKNKKWDSYFLYSYLNFKKPLQEWYKRHFNILSEIDILFPPLPEQTAIANILSTVDTTIQQTQEIIRKLEARNKGLGHKLLTGKTRVKGFDDKWESQKLWDIIEFYEWKTQETNKYPVFTSSKWWLMLQTDYYWNNRLTERDNSWFNIVPDWYITYRSRSDDAKFTFNINTYWITGIVSKYYPVFTVKKWLNSILTMILNMHQEKIWSYSIWTSQLVLWIKELKQISIILPSIEEQEKIAEILDKATKEVKEHKQKLVKLQTLKKWLMQQLLTGKVRMKEFRK